jgi:Rhodopirellula transposase DDE domain
MEESPEVLAAKFQAIFPHLDERQRRLSLVGPDERGDPMSPLRWTVKSTRNLAAELARQGHRVAARDHQGTADPVISEDTKKKELVGELRNAGRE